MKIVFFYLLFLVSLIAFSIGFSLCYRNWIPENDALRGSSLIGFGIFSTFILWKNNFFTKSKS
jgi:hypothetical protein